MSLQIDLAINLEWHSWLANDEARYGLSDASGLVFVTGKSKTECLDKLNMSHSAGRLNIKIVTQDAI